MVENEDGSGSQFGCATDRARVSSVTWTCLDDPVPLCVVPFSLKNSKLFWILNFD